VGGHTLCFSAPGNSYFRTFRNGREGCVSQTTPIGGGVVCPTYGTDKTKAGNLVK
jgi:hypothetical protein